MSDDRIEDALASMPRHLFWQARLALLANHACGLLRLAGEPVNPQTILGVVKSLPPSPWHADGDGHWQRTSFCHHCVLKAEKRWGNDHPELSEIWGYFIWLFSGPAAARNRIAVDAFIAILAEIDAAMHPGREAGR